MKSYNLKKSSRTKVLETPKTIDLYGELMPNEIAAIESAVNIRRSHITRESGQAKPRGNKKFYGDCPSGKVRHRYKEGAIRALRMISNSRKAAEERGESYRFKQYRIWRCNQCSGFHLSSKPAFPIVEVADVA